MLQHSNINTKKSNKLKNIAHLIYLVCGRQDNLKLPFVDDIPKSL